MEVENSVTRMLASLASLCVRFKDRSFKDEAEWRMVSHPNPLLLDVKFREGRYGLTPYVELPLGEALKDALVDVWIGPSVFRQVNTESVKELLSTVVLGHAPVHESRVPYRL